MGLIRPVILFFVLSASGLSNAGAQSFGTLTAIPTHPRAGLQLTWGSAPAGVNTVNRWVDGGTPAPIGTVTGTSYLDTNALSNVIYYYGVSNGASITNTAIGVIS